MAIHPVTDKELDRLRKLSDRMAIAAFFAGVFLTIAVVGLFV